MKTATSKVLINKLIPPIVRIVESEGFECLDCRLRGHSDSYTLSITLDRPTGKIEVSDCEGVSRKLSEWLDSEDLISGRYYLEVGSPGLERPLKTLEHYKRFIGKKVCLRLPKGKKIKGTLSAAELSGEIVVLLQDGTEARVEITQIRSANLEFEIEKQEKKKHS